MEAPWPRAEIHQEFLQGVPRCFFTCCGNSYDSMVGVEGAWTLDVAILEDKLERSRRGNQSVFSTSSEDIENCRYRSYCRRRGNSNKA